MEGSDDHSQLTLEVDQVDHLFPFGTAGKEKHVFLQNTTTNWRPANWFLLAIWRIQGNGCYPSFASSEHRAVNDKTVGACWQRIFSKKAASSLSLLIMFFCGFMFSEK